MAGGLGLGVFVYGFVRLVSGYPPLSLAEGLPVALLVGLVLGLVLCAVAKLALRQAAYDLHQHAVALTDSTLSPPVAFSGDDMRYMRAIFSQAVDQVPRAEALPHLAQKLTLASDENIALATALKHISEHLPIQGAILLVVDAERGTLTSIATWGLGRLTHAVSLDLEQTAIGRALLEGRTAHYSGAQVRELLPLVHDCETMTLFCLPQLIGKQPFGTLCLLGTSDDMRLSPEQRAFAQGAADMLVLAVQNQAHRRLFERETTRLVAFEQLGALLAGSEHLGPALEQVLVVAARVTDSQHGSLLLLDADESQVRYRFTLKQGDVLPLSVTVGPILKHGLAGWALRERRADIIEDTERDSRWLPVPGLDDMRSVLVVPLLYGERALGILTLADPTPRHYSRRSLALTSALAAYAVTILARSQHQQMVSPGQNALARRLFEGHVESASLTALLGDPAAVERKLSPQTHEAVALYVAIGGLERCEERLDARQLVAEVLTPFTAELSAIAYEHQGYLASRDDTGALLLFGYPNAHGDLRMRAMRAALAVQTLARRLRGRWRTQLGCELSISAGLAAGTVVAGVAGDGAFRTLALIGSAVREAARLQRLARAEEILVDETLVASLGGESVFQLESLTPFRNGNEAAHPVYRLKPGRGQAHGR
jgi:class 3 adenylate cyclase/GAF domain-containing protein